MDKINLGGSSNREQLAGYQSKLQEHIDSEGNPIIKKRMSLLSYKKKTS